MICATFCFRRPWTFLFVYEISLEPLNGYVPNSQGRRVWTSLNVKVEGKRSRSPGTKNGIFWPFRWPACFLFGKTSLALVLAVFDPSSLTVCINRSFLHLRNIKNSLHNCKCLGSRILLLSGNYKSFRSSHPHFNI